MKQTTVLEITFTNLSINNLSGTLYIIATPIGNLEDITLRSLRLLKEVSFILAEDTRHSLILLKHYQIEKPLYSYNDHNKERKTPAFLEKISEGSSVALICDAGTPSIADPSFYISREAQKRGFTVTPIPGPCAVITSLMVSTMPTDRFLFCNFPPKKSSQRIKQLEYYKNTYQEAKDWVPTLVYYIGNQQILKFLNELKLVFGNDLRVTLARELTKKFEEFLINSVSEHLQYYHERKPKGEFVLLFHPQK